MRRLKPLVALVLAGGLSSSPRAWAYGESDEAGRPSAAERRLHLLTNRVRAEPHAFPGWDTSLAPGEPRPPLALEPSLFEAARFHADDMAATAGCFQHDSCDGTPFADRLARFFSGLGVGENIARGQPDERAVLVRWMNSRGHRQNILNPRWNALGTGASPGPHWVQNFGLMPGLALPPIVSGAIFPSEEGASEWIVAAHVHDPSGRAPSRVEAIVSGARVALSAVAGVPGNATFEARAAAPSGGPSASCFDVVLEHEDARGVVTRFPTTGALLAGEACPSSFRAGEGEPLDPVPGDVPPRPGIDADGGRRLGPGGLANTGDGGGGSDSGAGCRAIPDQDGGGALLLLMVALAASMRALRTRRRLVRPIPTALARSSWLPSPPR